MGDKPLHPAEWDLFNIAERHVPDGFLRGLLSAAEEGMGAHVGLLANGCFIYGQLAPRRLLAEDVDAYFEWMIDVAQHAEDDDHKLSPEKWSAAREHWMWSVKAVEETDAATNKFEEELPDDFDANTAPGDKAREWHQRFSRSFITLKDAIIVPSGGQPVKLPILRMPVEHVVGWWLVRERGEDGTVTIKHPPPGSEDLDKPRNGGS